MKKRQWIISTVLSLIILLIAAFAFQKLKANKQSTISEEKPEAIIREVVTQQFESSNLASTIELDGRLNAYEKINLGAEVTGKLLPSSNNFKVGSYFKEGDLLFQIDSKDQRFSLYALRSDLLNAITQMMPDLKFDHPNAFPNWKKYLDEFDLEKTTVPLPKIQNEKEKYYIAGKNIFKLYYNIKSAEDRLSNYNIYAPFNGVFLSLNVYPGALVSPGTNLGQIMNTARFELIAPIAMSDLKYISTGQRVQLYAEELDKKWTGSVSRIAKQIDQTTQSVPVYITVSGQGLKDGVFVKGKLKGSNIKEAVELSRSLIIDQNHLFLYDQGKVKKKQISILSRSDQKLVVKGLDPSDQVIVSGIANLYEGQEVALRK